MTFAKEEDKKQHLLANIFQEYELVEFFGSSPTLDDTEDEREFFETRTFIHTRDGSRLELSLDLYTSDVTIQLFSSGAVVFESSISVESGATEYDGKTRTLSLEGSHGTLLIRLPELLVRLTKRS